MSARRLELQAVSQRYRWRGPWVLDEVSLTVAAGEVVQIVAGNGGGKSTLLRVAAGLQPPSRGRVRAARPRRYVPEHLPVPPALTVRRYLAHQARLQGVPGAAVAAWVDAVVDRHALGPVADRPLGRLSKGWGQRCLLAPALGAPAAPGPGLPGPPPELVVLDEPWTGVDTHSRDRLVEVVTALAGTGAAVVLASHEPVALPGLRSVRLRGGRLDAPGPPGDTDPAGPAPAPAPVTRTATLVARADAPPLASALLSAPGVVAVRGDGGRCLLVVTDDADGDRVLVAVLQRGWSIEHLVTGNGA
jgi:ABC-type Mn2+/Zn2+ transport system ATPase subunit